MGEVTGGKKTAMLLVKNARNRLRQPNKQSAVLDRVALARQYGSFINDARADGQVSSKIRVASSKVAFIRSVLHTGNKKAKTDNKSMNSHRNLLNRGIKEWAKAGGGVDFETAGLPAEFLDGGKRGRRKLTVQKRQHHST